MEIIKSSKHFSETELACRCGCGTAAMNPIFMERLESLREAYGKPLKVTSAYRCPQHNDRVSSTGASGPHTTGRAIDLAVYGTDAFEVERLAYSLGFTGFGRKGKGAFQSRFVHLDDLESSDGRTRPYTWTY